MSIISDLINFEKYVVFGFYSPVFIFGWILYKEYPDKSVLPFLVISAILSVIWMVFSAANQSEFGTKPKDGRLANVVNWKKVQKQGFSFIVRGWFMLLAILNVVWACVAGIIYTINHFSWVILILDIISFCTIILMVILGGIIMKKSVHAGKKIVKNTILKK